MRFLRGFALWSDQQINFVSFFGLLAAPGVSWGPPGGLRGVLRGASLASWGPPGRLLGASWGLLAASSGLLGRSWSLVGLMLGFLNPTWARQG